VDASASAQDYLTKDAFRKHSVLPRARELAARPPPRLVPPRPPPLRGAKGPEAGPEGVVDISSDSEGAVTSRAGLRRGGARRQRAPAAAAPEPQLGDDEDDLEVLLEQTLREDQESQEATQQAPAPAPRRGGMQPRPRAPAAPAAAPAAAEEGIESENRSDSGNSESSGGEDEVEAQPEPREQPAGDAAAGGEAGGAAAAANAAIIAAALKRIGMPSWEALVAHVIASAQPPARPGRKKSSAAAAADVSLADILNPTSRVHHPAFADAYPKERAAAARREVKRKRPAAGAPPLASTLPLKRWSALSPADHAWFVQHEGEALAGAEAERLAALTARVAAERSQYWSAVVQQAQEKGDWYQHLTDRQNSQLASDVNRRRERAAALPRFYVLHEVVNLAAAAAAAAEAQQQAQRAQDGGGGQEGLGAGDDGALVWEREVLRSGTPPELRLPAAGASLPGDTLYLPAAVDAPPGAAPRQPRGAAAPYRKLRVPPLADDPAARQALAAAGGGGGAEVCAAAGALASVLATPLQPDAPAWEIPVTVVEADEGGGRSVVFLDKPLAPRTETLRAKHRRLQKYAVLSLALAAAGAAQGGTGLPPREATYNLYRLGGARLVVRSHARVQAVLPPPAAAAPGAGSVAAPPATVSNGQPAQPEDAEQPRQQPQLQPQPQPQQPQQPQPPRPLALAIKVEYLPEPDAEEETPGELARWWAKAALTPGTQGVAVVRVHVPRARVLGCAALAGAEVEAAAGGAGRGAGGRVLAELLRVLRGLPPGQYLLSHGRGEPAACVYRAVQQAAGPAAPLPAGAAAAQRGALYDLHAAHERSGELDAGADPFVRSKWRPHDAGVAQIPYTFPPR
jgi:hypothetical protein